MTRFLVTLFGLLFVLSGCAGPSAVISPGQQGLEYSGSTYFVFFGRSIEAEQGEAVYVSDADWTAFETTEIASRLNGYTVLDGLGGYTLPGSVASDQLVIHEHTKVLIYVDGESSTGTNVITDIAEEYKDQFHQHSVLVVRLPSDVMVVE